MQGAEGIEGAGYSKEQLKLFEKNFEPIIYVGICLANYLLLDALFSYSVTTFGLYLEAIRSDCKFIEDLKAWHLENRQLIKVVSQIENYLQGRNNNSKAKSTMEQIKYVMFLNSYQKDLIQIKSVLKEYLSIEINHSSKNYFYESELVDLWRNLAHPFQNMTSTIINSMPL